jgi:hypothetical protein
MTSNLTVGKDGNTREILVDSALLADLSQRKLRIVSTTGSIQGKTFDGKYSDLKHIVRPTKPHLKLFHQNGNTNDYTEANIKTIEEMRCKNGKVEPEVVSEPELASEPEDEAPVAPPVSSSRRRVFRPVKPESVSGHFSKVGSLWQVSLNLSGGVVSLADFKTFAELGKVVDVLCVSHQ